MLSDRIAVVTIGASPDLNYQRTKTVRIMNIPVVLQSLVIKGYQNEPNITKNHSHCRTTNIPSSLQTELGDRQMDTSIGIWGQPMPLHQTGLSYLMLHAALLFTLMRVQLRHEKPFLVDYSGHEKHTCWYSASHNAGSPRKRSGTVLIYQKDRTALFS